jgi:hypothetical protein
MVWGRVLGVQMLMAWRMLRLCESMSARDMQSACPTHFCFASMNRHCETQRPSPFGAKYNRSRICNMPAARVEVVIDHLPVAAKVPAIHSDGDRRDLRLDACRGLALWFIFIDHIPDNALAWLTLRNYGFSDATEVFVFVSGYTCCLPMAARCASKASRRQ